jgi:hypothetical protein
MLRASDTKVQWDNNKSRWNIVIQVGAETIRRPCPDQPHDTDDEALRLIAVHMTRDEGYEMDPGRVAIQR